MPAAKRPTNLPRPTRSNAFFRRYRVVILIVVALCAVFAADVAGTAVLAATGLYTPASQAETFYRCEHPAYHHGLKPDMDVEDGGTWGHLKHTVRTNSLGCKDATCREVAPEPKGRRVVLIGDSFTEGVGYAYEQTFAGLMAAALAQRGIEVLNAGCSTYSPVIYRRKVRWLVEQERLRFDHLVVFLDVSDIVDEVKYYRLADDGSVVHRDQGFDSAWKDFVADHTILLNAIRTGIRRLRHGAETVDRRVVDIYRSSWTHDPELWRQFGEPGIALAGEHLDALWRFVRERGIAMTLVVYPWPDQILRAERDCVQVTHWRDWTAQRGIGFIDLFPAFLDAGPAEQVVADFYIRGDMHWNERGHELVAREVLERVRL